MGIHKSHQYSEFTRFAMESGEFQSLICERPGTTRHCDLHSSQAAIVLAKPGSCKHALEI